MRITILIWLLLYSLLIVISCKKNSVSEPEIPPTGDDTNSPPGDFSVTPLSISWDSAKISWTAAIDPDNDTIIYKVYLNDTLKTTTGLTEHIFKNLVELTDYTAKIIAVDSKGAESLTSFSFKTKKYWLTFLKKIEYGNISGYSYQACGPMIIANDGGYIIPATTQQLDDPSNLKILIVKIDSLGNELWRNYYDYNNDYSSSLRVVSVPEGYVFYAGGGLMKIDNSGQMLWHNLSGYTNSNTSMTANSIGEVFIASNILSEEVPNKVEASLCKYDKNGNFVWAKNYAYAERDEFFDITIHNDNEIALLGISGTDNESDFLVVKTDMDGNELWIKKYSTFGSAFPTRIIRTREGNYAFTGFSLGYNYTFYLQMIDPAGNSLWSVSESNDRTSATAIVETKSNNLIVTGGVWNPSSNYIEISSSEFEKSGSRIWQSFYDEYPALLTPKGLIPTADGGVIMNIQKDKTYNYGPEVNQIYVIKSDDRFNFE